MNNRADLNLEQIYELLFASLEELESTLKSNNKKAALTACSKTLEIITIYSEKTNLEGNKEECLDTAVETISTLSTFINTNDVLSTQVRLLQKNVIDPIWHFHAKRAQANETICSQIAERLRIEQLRIEEKLRAELTSNQKFEYLPTDVMSLILVYLTSHEMANVTQTCKQFHGQLSIFKSTLNIKRAFRALKEITEGGNIELVKKITEANHNILLKKIKYTHYTGKECEHTFLQAALHAYDAPMKDMLKKQVEKYYGKQELERQIKEEVLKWKMDQKSFDFTDITKAITNSSDADILAALDNNDNDTPICLALKTFREDFRKHMLESPNFTPAHAFEAVNIVSGKNWNENQCSLFNRKVLGLVQRYFPAVVLQEHAQNIKSIFYHLEQSNRSFQIKSKNNANVTTPQLIINPSRFLSCSGLGHNIYLGYEFISGSALNLQQVFYYKDYFAEKNSEFASELVLCEKPLSNSELPEPTLKTRPYNIWRI